MTKIGLGPAQLELSDWGVRVFAWWPYPTWEVRYYELRDTVQPVRWPVMTALAECRVPGPRHGILFRPDASVAMYRSRWSALTLAFFKWRSADIAEIVAQLDRRGVSVEKEVARFSEADLWT
jgi:hypothetical protein